MRRLSRTSLCRSIVPWAVFGVAIIGVGALAVQLGTNVNVSQRSFNQAEVTIAVNPTNPSNLIAASNSLESGLTQDLTWFSTDGGTTWTLSMIPNPTGSMAGGDPSIVFDRQGNAYYSHLIDCGFGGCDVASAFSTDGGQNWTAAKITTGSGNDKNFFGVGPDVNDLSNDRVYVGYQKGGVQFVQSTTNGLNWSAPRQVSDGGNNGINIQLAVSDTGTVYAAWQGIAPSATGFSNIYFDVSNDGGQNWGTDSIAYVSNVAAFRDIFTASTCGSQYCVPAAPDRGIGAFLSLETDRSGGAFNGRIYMVVVDQGDLDNNPDSANAVDHHDTDIFLLYSDDQGQNWTGPVRVNDDSTQNSQFTPWMDVDQVSGAVGVGWYDTRNDNGLGGAGDTNGIPNDDVQFFVTASFDGGASFIPNIQVSQGTSNQSGAEPYPAGFANFDYGEYPGLAILNRIAHAAWSDNSNSTGDNPDGTLGKQDLYTARINVNTAPFCDADGPYVAECGRKVTLDGTGSFDSDGDALSFLWSGAFEGGTATGPTPQVKFTQAPGSEVVTLKVDDGFEPAMCTANVTVQDTIPPEIQCNSPATIVPPDTPIAFTAGATDLCQGVITTQITDFDCFSFTKKGRRIDKTGSCQVSVSGNTVSIEDSGGVGDNISWTVVATDASGNSSTKTCSVVVENPGKGKN